MAGWPECASEPRRRHLSASTIFPVAFLGLPRDPSPARATEAGGGRVAAQAAQQFFNVSRLPCRRGGGRRKAEGVRGGWEQQAGRERKWTAEEQRKAAEASAQAEQCEKIQAAEFGRAAVGGGVADCGDANCVAPPDWPGAGEEKEGGKGAGKGRKRKEQTKRKQGKKRARGKKEETD
eukprot:GHVT01102052.1.p1 GENE.GHVT01102052.1~~GHVT01102052.1.p1  ORF type:complete len:178 (-),score=39.26 GHVT01102052.1:122-655(-)